MRKIFLVGIFSLLVCMFAAVSYAQVIPTPWMWRITSDFGPRDVTDGTWFHEGIDYGGPYGAGIPAVEGGIIDSIVYSNSGGWNISVIGSNGLWRYFHIFAGVNNAHPTPVASGNWELAQATLVNPDNGAQQNSNVIILWSDSTRTRAQKVLSINDFDNSRVLINSNPVFGISNTEIRSRGSVAAGADDPIAPVGTSGGNNGVAAHLHLGFRLTPNDPYDNPLFHLIHGPDGLPAVTIETPPDEHVFTSEELNSNYAISVDTNTTGGPDLDEVHVFILQNNDSNQIILLGEPTFGYGGRVGEAATQSASTPSNGTTTGVQPYRVNSDSLGHDRFIYVQNFSSLNLPDGEHSLVVRAVDVNRNVAPDVVHHFTIHSYPIVVSTTPSNGSYNVPTTSPITITFNKEMDTASVESAVSFSPSITSSYTWSSDKKTATITLSAPGLSASTNYTATVSDYAKDAQGNQLDGNRDGTAGGSYTFTFSTKPANIKITGLTHEYYDGQYWVKAGTKTVTVQLVDNNGNPILTSNPPQLTWTSLAGGTQPVNFTSTGTTALSWSGTITVTTASGDGQAAFTGVSAPVSGVTTFMIDTKPPTLQAAPVSSPGCRCPYGPLAFQYDAADSGSGIADITPVGLGLSAYDCHEPGNYQYGASLIKDKAGNTTRMVSNISVINNKCVNPDDNYSAIIQNIPGVPAPSIGIADKKIAILGNGYVYAAQRFLADKVKTDSIIIDIDFSPEIYSEYPLLIIPTGGLSGLVQSESFKARLSEYAKKGGTIFSLSQNQGYEFEALPEGKLTGYGYSNDQQCFLNAAYITNWHQVLSGQDKSNLDLNIDGFLTGFPSGGQSLLTRVSNGQSALVIYPYGNGHVIATTLYTDWGYSVSQYTVQEINLIRDIVAWGKLPMALPEVRPEQTVSVSLPVMNAVPVDATAIKILIRDPAKGIVAEQISPTVVHAGESTDITVPYAVSASAPLGIWWVNYTLLGTLGDVDAFSAKHLTNERAEALSSD